MRTTSNGVRAELLNVEPIDFFSLDMEFWNNKIILSNISEYDNTPVKGITILNTNYSINETIELNLNDSETVVDTEVGEDGSLIILSNTRGTKSYIRKINSLGEITELVEINNLNAKGLGKIHEVINGKYLLSGSNLIGLEGGNTAGIASVIIGQKPPNPKNIELEVFENTETTFTSDIILEAYGDINNDPIESFIVKWEPVQMKVLINGTHAVVDEEYLVEEIETITIIPDEDFIGPTGFSYQVTDGFGTSENAWFNVTVLPKNNAPVIETIANQIFEQGENIVISVSIMDLDNDLNELEIEILSNNNELISDNSFRLDLLNDPQLLELTPIRGIIGTSDITIYVSDGELNDSETFSIQIVDSNTPLAFDINVMLEEDQTVELSPQILIDAIENASKEKVNTFRINSIPSYTQIFINSSLARPGDEFELALIENINLIPTVDFFGSDSFSFQFGNEILFSENANFNIEITPLNDPPIIEDIADQTFSFGSEIIIPINISDIDDTDEELIVEIESSNLELIKDENYVVDLTSVSQTLTITPESNSIGNTEIILSASDGDLTAESHFFIEILTPTEPEAEDIVFSLTEDQASSFNSDIIKSSFIPSNGGNVEKFKLTSLPINVQLLIDDNEAVIDEEIVLDQLESISVIPDPDYFGNESFTYQVSDAFNFSENANFNIEVTPVNDAPVIGDIEDLVIQEGEEIIIGLNVSDIDNSQDELITEIFSSNEALIPVENLVVELSEDSQTLSVTPLANTSGTSEITISVSDGELTAISLFIASVETVTNTIDEIQNELSPYPNPSASKFQITNSQWDLIKITTNTGRTLNVKVSKVGNTTVLDLGKLSPGIYHAHFQNGELYRSIKLIKR